MLDGLVRAQFGPWLQAAARPLARMGVSANAVTFAACALGLAAACLVAWGEPVAALVPLLASRIGDELDGAVAAIRGRTDFGGFLDIVLDFTFYGAIPLGFVVADPVGNAVAGAVLLFAFYVNGASFLAFSAIAAERGLKSIERGPKSLFFTTGLAEASETLAVFVACCILPDWFAPIAYGFAAICLYTALARILLAAKTFGHDR